MVKRFVIVCMAALALVGCTPGGGGVSSSAPTVSIVEGSEAPEKCPGVPDLAKLESLGTLTFESGASNIRVSGSVKTSQRQGPATITTGLRGVELVIQPQEGMWGTVIVGKSQQPVFLAAEGNECPTWIRENVRYFFGYNRRGDVIVTVYIRRQMP